MLRRDYIMKLISQMTEALFLLLNRKDLDDNTKRNMLDKFYPEYFGEQKDFYQSAELEEILIFFENKYGHEEVLLRIEMLSEVLYNESMLANQSDKAQLFQKTLKILSYLDENSDTYSLVREGKIDTIKRELLLIGGE